ncbi:MAG: nitroreductase family protein [Hyphomicrobiales bacterium]|nr:nitroreductase family protein [Hyphomicrobiales bacterium]
MGGFPNHPFFQFTEVRMGGHILPSPNLDLEQRHGLLADHVARLIQSRRSISPKRLISPGPSVEQLDLMIAAAMYAPAHAGLKPWRFLQIQDERREELAELFAAAKREQCLSATDHDLAKVRMKAHNGPCLLAVVIAPIVNHDVVTVEEQYIALGAAIENILLTAHSLGFGAMVTSGKKLLSPVLQSAFASVEGERLLAFITIGSCAFPLPLRSNDTDLQWLSNW